MQKSEKKKLGQGPVGDKVGCERRIEVIVKKLKKKQGRGGGGVRVNVNEESMLL